MPWSYPDDVPAVAESWTAEEQRRCVDAANAVLDRSGDEEQAIFACIAAAGKERGMNTKFVRGPVTFKESGDAGGFRAVFSTLNVIDKDGDVTLPGAFKDGEAVRISFWGHRWQDLPVGKGVIGSDQQEAWVDGQFFLDTEAGRETYQTVKNLGELQEWSYGYDVLDESYGDFDNQKVRFLRGLKVIEVSPVMLGAGVNTRTQAIKAGARHTAKEFEHIQAIHDLAVELGAKCATADDSGDGEGEGKGQGETPLDPPDTGGRDGKLRTPGASTLAARLAMELMEL